MTRSRLEEWKANKAREARRFYTDHFLPMFADECFAPSYPPRLSYENYPMRAGNGSLVTHQTSFGWSGDNLLIVSHAADGRSFMTVHGELPDDGVLRHVP